MINRAFLSLAFVACVALLSLASYVAVKSLRSNGERDYCYIVTSVSPEGAIMYKLLGHIPWREDNDIFRSQDFGEVFKRARELGCQIK